MQNEREELFPTPQLDAVDDDDSCGVDVQYDGEFKSITGVIQLYDLEGEIVRAKLLRSLREAIKSAKATRLLARKLAIKEGVEPQ